MHCRGTSGCRPQDRARRLMISIGYSCLLVPHRALPDLQRMKLFAILRSRSAYLEMSKRDGLPFRRPFFAEKQPEKIPSEQVSKKQLSKRRQPRRMRMQPRHILWPPTVTPRAIPRRVPSMPKLPSRARSLPQSRATRSVRRASCGSNQDGPGDAPRAGPRVKLNSASFGE
jgi:hypothetical protein